MKEPITNQTNNVINIADFNNALFERDLLAALEHAYLNRSYRLMNKVHRRWAASRGLRQDPPVTDGEEPDSMNTARFAVVCFSIIMHERLRHLWPAAKRSCREELGHNEYGYDEVDYSQRLNIGADIRDYLTAGINPLDMEDIPRVKTEGMAAAQDTSEPGISGDEGA